MSDNIKIHILTTDRRYPWLTKEGYERALEQLKDGMTQLEPDGDCCHVCHDSDHQAWECRHNPLVAKGELRRLGAWATRLHDQMHETMSDDDELTEVHRLLHDLMGMPRFMI